MPIPTAAFSFFHAKNQLVISVEVIQYTVHVHVDSLDRRKLRKHHNMSSSQEIEEKVEELNDDFL